MQPRVKQKRNRHFNSGNIIMESHIYINDKNDNKFYLIKANSEKIVDIELTKAGVYKFTVILLPNKQKMAISSNSSINNYLSSSLKYISKKLKSLFILTSKRIPKQHRYNNEPVFSIKIWGDSYGIEDKITLLNSDLLDDRNQWQLMLFCYVDKTKKISINLKNQYKKSFHLKNLIQVGHIWRRRSPVLQGSKQWEATQGFYGEDYYSCAKENAESGYDNAYRTNAIHNQKIFLSSFLNKLDYKTSLEIGSSMGVLLHLSLEAGKDAYGTDYSHFALKNGFDDNMQRIFCADLTKLPVKKSSFDLIFAQEVLEHISPEKVLPALQDIYEISKKYVIITVPCGGGFLPELITSFDKLAKDKNGNPMEGHLSVANITWWKEQVVLAGFTLNEALSIEISKSWGIYSSWWQLIIGEKKKRSNNYLVQFYNNLFSECYKKLRTKDDDILHIEGRISQDIEENHKIVQVNKNNQCGYILFGPYIPLKKGRYRATFEIKITSNQSPSSSDLILLEVKSQFGGKIHGNNVVKLNDFKEIDRYQKFNIDFDSVGEKGIEFTAYFCGKADIALKVPVNYKTLR
jgi:hypothetical protein